MMNTEFVDKNKSSQISIVSAYYWAIATNIVLLYAFNNIRFLNLPFLENSLLISCLWAINLALSFGIMGNFVLLLYHPLWFHYLAQVIMGLLAGLAVYVIYHNFPFVLNTEFLINAVHTALISVMTAIGIGVIFGLFKMGAALSHRVHPSPPLPPSEVTNDPR
jgi:hypothetical protein